MMSNNLGKPLQRRGRVPVVRTRVEIIPIKYGEALEVPSDQVSHYNSFSIEGNFELDTIEIKEVMLIIMPT